jgi:glycosyltransferase involved in cell wall biosynthesis/MoaA/NifB/PqqE/SkfB family radical SAM enzyme
VRICFFNDIPFLGGGEIWALRACRHLRSAGHEVSVVCPRRSELQFACQQEGIELFTTVETARMGRPFYTGLHHFLQEQQVDLIYCTVMGNVCEARILESVADRVNRERGRDQMAVVLKAGLPPMGDLTPEYYGAGSGPAVRRLHVVAEQVRGAFAAWEPGLAGEFVEVLHEGVDLAAFNRAACDPAEARQRFGVAGRTVVTCVARLLDGMKGQSVLLRCVPELARAHPDATFLIAGEGKDRELLEELRDDLQLQDAVRFLGHVDDMPSLLAATDILCHPSLQDGLPNAVVEAMSMSLPVVASRMGAIPELIEHGVTGMLVHANDVLGLKEALHTMLRDDAARTDMGQRARAVVEQRFDLHANLDHLTARLGRELEEFRASPGRRTAPPPPTPSESVPVMFVMNVIRTGGEETELAVLARYLDKRRFPLSVLALWDSHEVAPVVEELNAWGIPIDRTCASMEDDEDRVRYIVEKVRRDRVGIVVACHDAQIAHRAFAHLSPGECRLIEHGGILLDVEHTSKDQTARYVGVSPQITRAAAARMRDPSAAVFIPSMVDTEEYDAPDYAPARAMTAEWLSESLLEPHGFSPAACVVTFVGRLDPKKRAEDLVQAARALEADCPDAFFLMVGGADHFEPAYATRLMAEAGDLVERHRVAFTGTRADVPGILAASHILVLPSVGEGMAHVIQEAGAAGIAVIATDDGAAADQLENGRCGVLIEPGNVAQLTESLRSLIRDPERRTTLGHRLRERVRSRYAARIVIEQWHALFSDVQRELSESVRRANGRRPALRMVAPDETPSFPIEIQIQTNTFCNATCVMCPHPEVKQEVSMGHMEESLYRDILLQCAAEPGLKRIEPFLMNEPFTDKRLLDWIALAKETVPHADVTVTTNGALVTPAVSDRLVRSGLDAIWFSFNGAEEDTFEAIMGIPQASVVENIDYLLSVRPSTLRVCVNMIETTMMQPEIARNVRNWTRRGVEAGPSPLVNRGGNVRNYEQLNYRPINARPIRVCELVFYKMYILYNGDVVLCCMDWRRQVVLGNLRRQSLAEIWQGEQYTHIREKLLRRDTSQLELCGTCSYPLT